jgi:hypothetical protein
MKKKLIFAFSIAVLAAGLSFGISFEAKSGPPFCNNGVEQGNKNLGICYGSGPECFRCRIFAQVAQ